MVKAGYKQTDVGIIPKDWSVQPLAAFIPKLETGVSVNSIDKEQQVFGHDAFVLKTSCVSAGKFFPEECKQIIPRDISRAKTYVRKNNIVISRMNTPTLVGECGFVELDYEQLFLPDRLWMFGQGSNESFFIRWLSYLLSSYPIGRAIKESATGTSGSMKNISKGSLLGIYVPVPPTKSEQEAIAGALSDADALIESLEQLLTKKRQIKQGAMQELLTGKRRLPGFKGKWTSGKLRDFGHFSKGRGVTRDQANSGNIPCVRYGEIYTHHN
ncbi:MAG: restriction endonuclease subunit S, partial [Acidocella sp.]|nr:restriction endonuclease subunit S [Acidocella sp.]